MWQRNRYHRKIADSTLFVREPVKQFDYKAKFLSPEDRATERPEGVIDLLNANPSRTMNDESLRRALSFGFSGGFTVDAVRSALDSAKLEPSNFDPDCFKDGLFVHELIDICMKVRIGDFEPAINKRFLTMLMIHAPKAMDVIEFRRAILCELSQDAQLFDVFKQTYKRLYALRTMFESDERYYEPDNKRRRIEILEALKSAVERMASDFQNCKSGLLRISKFAERQMTTRGFSHLKALLEFDNHLAGVELNVRIGGDGRISRFEIVTMQENSRNRFYSSPLTRFLTRVKVFFRGYVFSETEVVNRWVDSVYEGVENIMPEMVRLIGEMEFYLASIAFKNLAESKGLSVGFPEFLSDGDASIEMEGLFNPLLFGQQITPVPCNLKSDRRDAVTVVTGPNSGGKTRLLQAVATLQMLAECGMYASAKRARLHRAAGLFVSLIEEAKADQKEGRLGTELIRIRDVFERSRPDSLVILDELCSGTNPSEGEEIFRLVVSLLAELRPRVFITTHFLKFAQTLARENTEDSPLRFLRVELDETDQPTFQFLPGVATTSLAHLTAARLGVTRDELLALIRRNSVQTK